MIRCSQCGRDFDPRNNEEWIASISGTIMGDETIETFYYCEACGVYTVEVYHDRFLGADQVDMRGPVSKTEGDAAAELIKQCSEPWNKKCRCEAHRSYFGPSLD